jgi:hypothetical protein
MEEGRRFSREAVERAMSLNPNVIEAHTQMGRFSNWSTAVFEYPPANAPISWHLSPSDKREIETIWASDATQKSKEIVRTFLYTSPPLSASTTASCR